MLDLKTKRCPRPKSEGTFCLKVQHIICCPNPLSIIVLLYPNWCRIKHSIQTTHKQTDNDQTGLNLDELIWNELVLCKFTLTSPHLSTSPILRQQKKLTKL